MCTYLTKRGATYYFRRVIPDDLRAAFNGAGEFMFSLRTKDREEAKRKTRLESVRTDRLLEEARAGLDAPARSKGAATPYRGMTTAELEQAEHAARDEAERDARWEAREPLRRRLESILDKTTLEITPEEAAMRDLLRDARQELTIERERRISAVVREAEARRGIRSPESRLALPAAPTAAEARPEQATGPGGGVMLDTTIVDLWAAERKPVQKGIDTHRQAAEWLYARIGKKPVPDLTKADILAYKAKLVEEGQSAANIKMKLSRVRTLLQWAADNGYAQTNVAQGVTIKDTDAARNKRKPFDLTALNAIFASPVYVEGSRPKRLAGEAGYWLPLLALFTGARLEELGQLRPDDVIEETYPDADGHDRKAWIIHIREDEAAGLNLKNAASERRVPVHPELERLGFIGFVEEAREGRQERLFPLLKPNVYGRLTAKWGEWWSVYRRDVCGVTDRRMVFHSFRHTFKDFARHAGIGEGVQRQLMGHSSGDVADDYGSGYSLHQLVEGIRAYKVPGLRLPSASAQ